MQTASFETRNSGHNQIIPAHGSEHEALPPPKSNKRSRKDRVNRACKACRRRKVKCSGSLPNCKSCEASAVPCVYEQSRRDRLQDAKKSIFTLHTLLRDLSHRLNDEDKQKIKDALEDVEDDILSQQGTELSINPTGTRQHSTVTADHEGASEGELYVGGATGSNEGLDYLNEDLTRSRDSRQTGYVGHNSEVRWLSSVQRQTEHTGAEPRFPPYGPPGSGIDAINARSDALHTRRRNAKYSSREGSMKNITDASFYLDSSNTDVDIFVDPYEVPDVEVAEKLFACYMETVHSSFPLISTSFEDQFCQYLNSLKNRGGFLMPDKWRARMNIVFAIGAKYSHLIGADWRGDERDHLVYMARAVHLLGLKDTISFISAPNLELVQALSALSFYFLTIGHVSRAWILTGLSLRLALALGMHLRNEDPTITESRKETLVHTWWSLNSIECLLSTVTGRPPAIAFDYHTVPLPYGAHSTQSERKKYRSTSRKSRYESDGDASPQATGSRSDTGSGERIPVKELQHISRIKMSLISQETLSHLYSPQAATQSWKSIQSKISKLRADLENWRTTALCRDSSPDETNFDREHFLLEMSYWSATILATRPCLCRLERRIRHQSDSSANFDANAAEACINAALEVAKLFPSRPNIEFIYTTGPWWNIVHIIMQSTAVLLLEMAYGTEEARTGAPPVSSSIKKLIRWLRAMQKNDLVAARAYEVLWRILKACAPALQAQAADILAMDVEESEGEDPVQRHPQDIFNEQATATAEWQQPDFFQNSMISSGTFDPDSYHQQPPSQPLSEYLHDPMEALPAAHIAAAMPFGNPFFTNFDQVVPVADVQDLWPAPGSQPFDYPDADMPTNFNYVQNQHEALHDLETGTQLPHQQQYW